MVMVEIIVPALDKEYDFKLDEQAPVNILIDEIAEVVCRREQSTLGGDERQLMLCDMNSRQILDRSYQLNSYGIVNGARLLLV